jgi:uncharacterized membrane protein
MIQKMSGYRLACVLLVLGNLLLVAVLYHWLPDPYPTRIDSNGLMAGFRPKPLGPFITPGITAVVLLGMLVFPRLSPKRFRVDGFRRVFDLLYLVSIAASVLSSVIGMLHALGIAVPHAVSGLSVSVTLIVFGNFLGKTTKNFWLGIRTPWTLASDEVWLRTHRLAGVLLMGAGFVHLATTLTGASNIPFMIALFLALLTAVVASYVFYRRIHHAKD